AFKGKLKGAIVLLNPPAKLRPWDEIEKVGIGVPFAPVGPGDEKDKISREERIAIFKAQREMLTKGGVAAILSDAGKHFNLLMTTGSWGSKDRPSASSKIPSLSVAHEHYAMLWRLASRPGPEKTRIELEMSNK